MCKIHKLCQNNSHLCFCFSLLQVLNFGLQGSGFDWIFRLPMNWSALAQLSPTVNPKRICLFCISSVPLCFLCEFKYLWLFRNACSLQDFEYLHSQITGFCLMFHKDRKVWRPIFDKNAKNPVWIQRFLIILTVESVSPLIRMLHLSPYTNIYGIR